MQKCKFDFRRVMATLLILVTLLGFVPSGLIQTAYADQVGGAASQLKPGGSSPKNWGVYNTGDMQANTFTRYSLVGFPDGANHTDNYEVIGAFDVFATNNTFTTYKDYNDGDGLYWYGAVGSSVRTSGHRMTAVDYAKHGFKTSMGVYSGWKQWAGMTVSEFEVVISHLLSKYANEHREDISDEDYAKYYTPNTDPDGDGKSLIADWPAPDGGSTPYTENKLNTQFGSNFVDADSSEYPGARPICESGYLINGLVMFLSLADSFDKYYYYATDAEIFTCGEGDWETKLDNWLDKMFTVSPYCDKIMTVQDFIAEDGMDYRILCEPGMICSTGGSTSAASVKVPAIGGTFRDLYAFALAYDGGEHSDGDAFLTGEGNMLRNRLAYSLHQTIDEFLVYDRTTYLEKLESYMDGGMSENEAVGKALTDAFNERNDPGGQDDAGSQDILFNLVSNSEANSKIGDGSNLPRVWKYYETIENGTSAYGLTPYGSYALGILAPYTFIKDVTTTVELEIEKTSNIPGGGPWSFTIELKDEEGNSISGDFDGDPSGVTFGADGTAVISLSADETWTIKDLPLGCTATVTEGDTGAGGGGAEDPEPELPPDPTDPGDDDDEPELPPDPGVGVALDADIPAATADAGMDYKTTVNGVEGNTWSETLSEMKTYKVTFDNSIDVTEFRVTKTVTGGGDTSKEWQFEVTFDQDVTGATYSIDGGTANTISGTSATFTLKHGQTALFSGLDPSVNYTVKETNANADGYTTDPASGEISGNVETDNLAAFKNDLPVPGGFTVEKKVTGDGDTSKSWEFTVTFTGDPSPGTYSVAGGADTPIPGGTVTFSLKHGEKAVFKNIPEGVSYSVVETEANADGYTTTPNSGNYSGTISTGSSPTHTFVNDKTTSGDDDDDDDDIIRKIDSKTNEGVGPATFHIWGEADDGGLINAYPHSNAQGLVHIQWTNPGHPIDYIPPGKYAVQEYVAPEGYELSTEVHYIVLRADGTYSGQLTFKNNKLIPIELLKTDSSGEPLAGAIFNVYKDGKLVGTATSGTDGIAKFEGRDGDGLTEGYYEFEETQAPAGFVIPKNNRVGVQVDPSDLSSGSPIRVSMKNWESTIIKLYKGVNGTNEPLAGAFFEVMIDGTSIGEFGPTEDDGYFAISTESIGKYIKDFEDHWTLSVKETVAPAGYLIDDDDWKTFEIEGGRKEITVPFTDTKYPEIIVRKRDMNDGTPLAGAVFQVWIGDNDIGEHETGPDGSFTISYEEYGEFLHQEGDETLFSVSVQEVQAPDGYIICDNGVHTKPLKKGDKVLEFEFEDWRYPEIEILKEDQNSHEPLDGAVFEVTVNGQNIGQFRTGDGGETGIIRITYEDLKRFLGEEGVKDTEQFTVHVKEIQAPDGYIIGRVKEDTKTITRGESVAKFVFSDWKYPELWIEKRDINHPEKLLPGATFEVAVDGNTIGEFTTGADGKIHITYDEDEEGDETSWSARLARWLREDGTDNESTFNVKVREIRAPEGYLIVDDGWKDVTFTRGQESATLVFDDMEYPEIWIRKLDAETGEPLAGMTFTVEIDGQMFTGNFQTVGATEDNPEGWYRISYADFDRFLADRGGLTLDPRGYTISVTEVHPPDHYNLDKQPGSREGKEYTFTRQLAQNQNHIEFTFEDHHYRNLKVRKIDSETNWGLADAHFRLWSIELDYPLDSVQDAVSVTGVTNSDGWTYFHNLPNGYYAIEEIAAPNGYDIDGIWEGGDAIMDSERESRITRFRITSDSGNVDESNPDPDYNTACKYEKTHNTHWITMTRKNDPMSGIRILKTDLYTGLPVAGAKFRITPKAPLTGPSFEVTTDSEGVAVIENNLQAGTYEVQEIWVPQPYILDSTVRSIEIKNQHDAFNLNLTNVAEGVLYIQKLDSVTGEPLAGAHFKITDGNGGVVYNGNDVGPTDASGFVMFGPLEPGKTYVVEEIKAPDGHELDSYPQTFTVPEDVSGFVKYLVFNNNPLANLWLKKVDAETGLPLAGAVFEIYKGSGELVKQTATTDAAGFIMINNLEPGTYIAKETKAPNGYILDETEHRIYLVNHSTEVIVIPNQKYGGLSIRKIDAATGDPLAGATFQLYNINGQQLDVPKTTGLDGYARWDTLQPGYYTVRETAAPDGYVLDSVAQNLEVKGFETLEYTWKNTQKATITIYKKDAETGVPLAGATFEVRSVSGELMETLTTDIFGSATTGRLPLGFYQIYETKAPDGYQAVEEVSQPIEVKADTPVVIERFNKSDKIIIIEKRDAKTKDPLPGAWFQLLDVDGNIIGKQFSSDASGIATSAPVEPGVYYIQETRAPEGYVLNTEPLKVTVQEGKLTRVTFDNMPKTVIMIYKTDAYSGAPLMGVEFAIADKYGNILEIVQTDKTGWAYSQIMQPGDYIVVETKTIQGYGLDKTEHRVEIIEGQNYILRLTNEPGVPIYIVKVDAETQKPLAGAHFELRYDQGHGDCMYIGTYITDEYGRITTEPVMPGFYMLKEVEAPAGYYLPEGEDAETRICVKAPDENGASNTILNEFWIENTELPILIVKKLDSTNGSPVQGAVFRLATVDGNLIGYQETDQNGEATWYHLEPGYYIVTEVEAPEDYDLTNCPSKTVHVELGKRNYVEFYDTPFGSLQVTLQDKESGVYLRGGQFTIIDLRTMLEVTTFSMDVTGTYVYGSLEPGWYEVTQKFAADGYVLLEAVIKVEIKAGEQSVIHFFNTKSGLQIEKVDAENTEKLLAGARFKVTRLTDLQVIGEYNTDQSGTVVIGGLEPGTYTVEEIVAPEGYVINDGPKTVDIRAGAIAHLAFTDSAYSSISIQVIDKESKDPIPGVRVEVWVQNGELVNTWTSDKTGLIETDKMAPGHYVLKVIDIPTGYTLETKEVTVELKAAVETTYTFELLSSGSVMIVGKDDEGQTVGGVKVLIKTIEGTIIGTYITNPDGTYILTNLEPGWYYAEIVEDVEGYLCSQKSQQFKIEANSSVTVEFVHNRVSTVVVSVVDQATQAGLNGVRFELWQQNGDKVGEYTSDSTGIVNIVNVRRGVYILKLIGSVDGYVAVEKEMTITVTDNRKISVKFEFIANSNLTVVSKDEKGNIKNMSFKITTLEGTVVGEYNTGDSGEIIIRDLAPGWYLIIETKAPEGYELSEKTEQRIEVKSGSSARVVFEHTSLGTVEIVVTDTNGNAIANAEFQIIDANGNVITTVTSNASGVIVVSNLVFGNYTIKLLSLPGGYAVSQTEWNVTVNSKTTVTATVEVQTSGKLVVKSNGADGGFIGGMQFELRTLEGALLGTYTTEASGQFTITDLLPGWYIVKEVKAPGDLDMGSEIEIRIEIKSGMSAEVVFNHVTKGSIELVVVDSDQKAVSGVKFELTLNGTLIETLVTDVNGLASVSGLAAGDYKLKLTYISNVYVSTKTEWDIKITSGSTFKLNVDVVSSGSLLVKSVDAEGNPVGGMKFEVRTDDGTLVGTFETGANGEYRVENLKPGKYIVIEINAPKNLEIEAAEQRFEITGSGSVELTFKHKSLSTVTIEVVDKSTHDFVAGVTVELWIRDGDRVGSYTTDATGSITIENVVNGEYVIKVVHCPEGFTVVKTEINITVTSNRTITATVELVAAGSIAIRSEDDAGNLIGGMEFTVTQVSTGKVIGTFKTDSTGIYVLTGLEPGEYVVNETGCPSNWELSDTTTVRVEVTSNKRIDVTFKHVSMTSLTVEVIDKDTREAVSGVVLELWVYNGDRVGSYTSDISGSILIEHLVKGEYVLKVIKAPEGFTIVKNEFNITVTSNRKMTVTVELVSAGSLTVKSEDDSGKALGGMEFTLTKSSTGEVVGTFVTDSTGIYVITGLEPGEYVITETKAPADWTLGDNTTQRVQITSNKRLEVTFKHIATSDLTVEFVDKTTRGPISGVTFELWISDGDRFGSYTSNEAGTVLIKNIVDGIYIIKVLTVPEGYTILETERKITITRNRQITEIFELVSAGSLAVRSEDDSGNLIGGMKFTVTRASDNTVVGTYETDESGMYIITGLEPGEYVVTETEAPANWNKGDAATARVQITSNKRIDVTFKHVATSTVTVDVVNGDSPVNGVEIELWEQNGAKLNTWTTDSTGHIVIKNMTAGWYILKMTKYPDTMVAVKTEITFEITQNQSLNFKFELTSNGYLTVISADDAGARLEGMSFEVRDLNETLIGSYVTGTNGEYKFDNLTPGWYIITETNAPEGFNISEATQRVEVKAGANVDVTFTHGSKSDLIVKFVEEGTGAAVPGVIFEFYPQNGDLLQTYTAQADGTVTIANLTNGYYVIKVTSVPGTHQLAQLEYTVQVTSGRTITYEIKLTTKGTLNIHSVDSEGNPIGGMKFRIFKEDGAPIVNGTTQETAFVVGSSGVYTFRTLAPGWYTIVEAAAPDGYNMDAAPGEYPEQRIEIKNGEIANVTFKHSRTYGLQIRTTIAQTGAGIAGASYDITNLEGLPITTMTSDEVGIAFHALTPGWYIITPKTAPDGFVFADATPKNIEVKGDALTVVDMQVTQLSSIRVKVINGATSAPVYNVRIQLKDGDNVISEYYTDNEGYITLDKSVVAGKFKIEMISVPSGYILDTIPKTIGVDNGATTEIVWKIYTEGGQIQVEVKSSNENVTVDKPAGALLQGAVFEVTNPDTYQVVATMISDSRGIAASPTLPIGRYIVKMVAAPAFYGLNESWSEEVRIKVNNDVVRINATCPSVKLGAAIEQQTNTTATTGTTIRVDVTKADSLSDVRLDNFYIHIKVPTDAARIVSLNPGKWNKPVWYKISYKTNANDYRLLQNNLNSQNAYTYDLSTQSLGLQAGEYVTDVRFEFGTVPAGFKMESKMTYGLYIQGVPTGYKMINRLEMGGLHSATVLSTNHITNLGGVANLPAELASSVIGGGEAVIAGATGQWVTNTSIWTTTIKNNGTLPKTGY